MKPFMMLAGGLSIVLAAGASRADVWDEGPDSDNACNFTSDNELIHGTSQIHDLATRPGLVADEDNFTLTSQAYSSYEAVLDGITGDLNNGGAPNFSFDRVNTSCVNVQSFQLTGLYGFSRSIRWEAGATTLGGGLHVYNPACGTACTTDDAYHVTFYDTTYTIPRFNNSASQVTILIVQNPTNDTVHVTPWFFDTAGTLLASTPFTLAPHATQVFNTSTAGPLQGQSGSIALSNDARYGYLSGKAVALEAATGFTFDTPMTARPH